MAGSAGRHRAARSGGLAHTKSQGRHLAKRTGPIVGIAAGAAVIALSSTMTVLPPTPTQLLADAYYMRGTNIGNVPTQPVYEAFVNGVITNTDGAPTSMTYVDYPGGFFPVSKGGLNDPTYNQSVTQGYDNLDGQVNGDRGVIIYGYSQSAVIASKYKHDNPNVGNTYVLVANPKRPNGGILMRFEGVTIPILDITFDGATDTNGDETFDVARQYDGWADFPKYPLNLLATANALAGIYYLHGKYESEVTPADLNDPTKTDIQKLPGRDTTYYTIKTPLLPLLMPLETAGVPREVLDILDPPLRYAVELGYDRSDYGDPTRAGLVPLLNPIDVATGFAGAVQESVDRAGGGTPADDLVSTQQSESSRVVEGPELGEEKKAKAEKPAILSADDDSEPKTRSPLKADQPKKAGAPRPIGTSAKRALRQLTGQDADGPSDDTDNSAGGATKPTT